MGYCLCTLLLLTAFGLSAAYRSEFLNDLLADTNLELPVHAVNISTTEYGTLSCSLLSRCTGVRVGDFFIDSNHELHYKSDTLVSTFTAADLSVDCSGSVVCNSNLDSVVLEFGLDLHIPWFALEAQVHTVTKKRSVIPTKMHVSRCNLRARLNRNSFRIVTNHDTFPLQVIDGILDEIVPIFAPKLLEVSYCGVLKEATAWLSILVDLGNMYLERVVEAARKRQATRTVSGLELSVDAHKGARKVIDFKSGAVGKMTMLVWRFTTDVLGRKGTVALLGDKLGLNRMQLSQSLEVVQSMLGARLGFVVRGIEITGLENVNRIELAKPVGKYTLQHKFSTGAIRVKVSLDLREGRVGRKEWNSQLPLTFSLTFSAPSVTLLSLVAVDQDALWHFALPSFRSNFLWDSVACDLSAIRNVSLPKTLVNRRSRIGAPVVASGVADDFPLLIQGLARTVMGCANEFGERFKAPFVSTVVFLFGEVLQELTTITTCGNETERTAPPLGMDREHKWVNWRKSRVAAYLRRLIPKFLVNDALNVNGLLHWALRYLSDNPSAKEDSIVFGGVVFDTGILHANHMFPSLKPTASLQVQLLNISLHGMTDNILETVDLFAPNGPFELSHRLRFRPAGLSINFTLAINATDLTSTGGVVENVLFVSLDSIADPGSFLEVLMSTRAQVRPEAALGVRLVDLLNGCWGNVFGDIALLSVAADYTGARGIAKFRARCAECSSNSLKSNVVKMSTQSGSNALLEKLEEKASEMLEFLNGRANLFDGFSLNHLVASAVTLAQQNCNGTTAPSENRNTWSKPWWLRMRLFMLIGAVCCGFTFLLVAYTARHQSKRQRVEQDERLVPLLEECDQECRTGLSSEVQAYRVRFATAKRLPDALSAQISLEDRQYLLSLDVALVHHNSIPRCTRVVLCVLIVVDFLLLVCSSMFVMGEVRIIAEVFGESLEVIPMLTLSLDNCIDMMLEGQAWLFAAFIGICSGMFPWLRVGILLYAWTTPPNVLSSHSRQRLLQTLSILGKWQFAEMYLFVILQVSMGVLMTNPSTLVFLEDRAFVVAIECVPQFGLLVFVIASVGATLLNEAVLTFHFKVDRSNKSLLGVEEPVQEAGGGFSLFNACKAIALSSLLLIAMFVNVYAFEFMGMAGMGIRMMSEDGRKRKAQSAISLLAGLGTSDPSHQASQLQLPVLVSVYALFVVVAPILSRLGDLIGCACGATRGEYKRRFIEDIAGIEVLSFTALVVVLQLGKFFAPFTSQLRFCPQFIGTVLKWGGAAARESSCFGTHVELLPSFSILCFYAIMCCAESATRLRHIWVSSR